MPEPENPASPLWRSTAVGVARLRAEHQFADNGAILSDPFALPILGKAAPQPQDQDPSRDLPRRQALRAFMAARSRIAEDTVTEAASERGVRQVVVLGAGLDTFGVRNALPDVTVFEIDRGGMQAFKRERIADAGITIPPSLRFVPIDFEHDALATVLAAAGFDAEQPAVFIWLGVIIYLTQDAIDATLSYVAQRPASTLVFDYSEPVDRYPPQTRAFLQSWEANVRERGEPWRSRFSPDQMHVLLTRHGFPRFVDFDKPALAHRFDRPLPADGTTVGPHVVVASTP